MKHLKTVLTISGVLALVAVFLPYVSVGDDSLSYWDFHKMPGSLSQGVLNGPKQPYVALVCFLIPTLLGLIAIATKQLQRWMSIVATVFALAAFACEGVRKGLTGEDGMSTAFGGKLLFVAALVTFVAALVGSIVAEKPSRT